MGRAVLFALAACSPLVIGALLGSRFRFPDRLLAAVLAFAAGALITALTFELFQASFEKGGATRAAAGLAAGALVFTGASVLLDRYVARQGAAPAAARSRRRRWAARPASRCSPR